MKFRKKVFNCFYLGGDKIVFGKGEDKSFDVSNLGGELVCLRFYISLVVFNKLISNYLLYESQCVIHIVYLSLFPHVRNTE